MLQKVQVRDENGQTTFEFDLTDKTITDGILMVLLE
jgi:hypothetical protein